jgi:hypothetical protein
MDAKLRRTAMINSGLLAFSFLSTTLQMATSGHPVVALIGAIATGLTVKDVVDFYNAK